MPDTRTDVYKCWSHSLSKFLPHGGSRAWAALSLISQTTTFRSLMGPKAFFGTVINKMCPIQPTGATTIVVLSQCFLCFEPEGFQFYMSLFQWFNFYKYKTFGNHLFIADTSGSFSFRRVCNEGLLVEWNEQFSDFQTVLHSPKSLIMHGFHFSVSLTFHINDHLLPDGKAMMVPNEVCLYQCSTWLTGLLWENRPLSVFSKD